MSVREFQNIEHISTVMQTFESGSSTNIDGRINSINTAVQRISGLMGFSFNPLGQTFKTMNIGGSNSAALKDFGLAVGEGAYCYVTGWATKTINLKVYTIESVMFRNSP